MTLPAMNLTNPRVAGASNGKVALALYEARPGELHLLRHTGPTTAAEYRALCVRAAVKLGYKPDARCRYGWRKTQ